MTDKLKANLQTLASDMVAQINCLKNSDDISWDCYDVGNWKCSLKSVTEIAKELNIDLEIEIEEEIFSGKIPF